MVREPSDAERIEFAPVVAVLLQALITHLKRPPDGIEGRLVTEAAKWLIPSKGQNSLAVGKTYAEWAKLVGADKVSSVRPAFQRLANAAAAGENDSRTQPDEGEPPAPAENALRASFPWKAETASGREVRCTLTVVRPGGQKNGAAGFEVSVTLDGEDVGERTKDGELKKRETKATTDRKEAIKAVASLLAENDAFRTKVAELTPEKLTHKNYALYEFGRLAIVLRVRPQRAKQLAVFLFLLIAGSALAHPKVRQVIRESATTVWELVTGGGRRYQPRSTPAPQVTPMPQPTPAPGSPFEMTITVDGRPGPMTAPSGERDFTGNGADGDPTEPDTATKRMGIQPWLFVTRTKECGPCVSVLAYPALRLDAPLRFRVDFGDGSPPVTYDTLGARAAERGGRVTTSGVYYSDKLGWEQVFVLQAGHRYPVEDAPYVVTVTVEPIAPGAPAAIVVLKRKIRIETFGVVSTDATITLPTPDPTTP